MEDKLSTNIDIVHQKIWVSEPMDLGKAGFKFGLAAKGRISGFWFVGYWDCGLYSERVLV